MDTHNNSAVQVADLESAFGDELLGKEKGARLDPQFRVRCHTIGKRLGDVDGRSIKAVLDAFTKAGIWPDDNTKFVKKVCFTQDLGEEDQTIIEIKRID